MTRHGYAFCELSVKSWRWIRIERVEVFEIPEGVITCVCGGDWKSFLETWQLSLALKLRHELDETNWDFLLSICWAWGTRRRELKTFKIEEIRTTLMWNMEAPRLKIKSDKGRPSSSPDILSYSSAEQSVYNSCPPSSTHLGTYRL